MFSETKYTRCVARLPYRAGVARLPYNTGVARLPYSTGVLLGNRNIMNQENYCDALKQVYDEASLKEVDINNLLEISIASDSIGGGKYYP